MSEPYLARHWPAGDGARVELRNGKILTPSGTAWHPEGARLVLQGGRIADLLLADDPTDPSADHVLDLEGRYVVPGLVNSHAHLALPVPSAVIDAAGVARAKSYGRAQVAHSLETCLERGITTVRDTWTEDLRSMDRITRHVAEGMIKGPRIQRSVMVSQPDGTFSERRGALPKLFHKLVGLPFVPFEQPSSGVLVFREGAGESEVRDAVDRAIDERGAQCIKVYDQRQKKVTYEEGATVMSQRQLDALADQARRRGVPATMHHLSRESLLRGVRAGVTSLAHLPIDQPLDEGALRAFVESETILEPTLSLAYFYSFALERPHPRLERLHRLRTPSHRRELERFWLEPIRPVVRRGLERAMAGRTRTLGILDLSPVYRFFAPYVSVGMDNLRLLWDACGQSERFACGNDAGAAPGAPAAIGLELELFDFCLNEGERSSFCGADALAVATRSGAKALGLDGATGVLAKGRTADLVVLDDDPIEDFRAIGGPVAALVLDGRLAIDRSGLQPEATGR